MIHFGHLLVDPNGTGYSPHFVIVVLIIHFSNLLENTNHPGYCTVLVVVVITPSIRF